VHHKSYLGDALIGTEVNIGAGTITCNYGLDRRKHRTAIGDRAYIGSDSMLVAPVRIGRGAATGAGSVVTRDVPAHRVAVGVPARVIRSIEGPEEARGRRRVPKAARGAKRLAARRSKTGERRPVRANR
jgi:bifunctional N-acetylglucosamine-1-phosphate-uridyltransferase/glucosamine-1-phosphate-acetyltransferase GlmU-like protein